MTQRTTLSLLALLLVVPSAAAAQAQPLFQPIEESPAAPDPQRSTTNGTPASPEDVASAQAPLLQVDGQLRSYLMSTINAGSAQDWTQWALGGHLGVKTADFHGLSLSGRFFVAGGPAGNSGKVDAGTGLPSRYEAGLFDFTDRSNKEVAVLGEAYVAFDQDGHHAWLGRHLLKTPMLNPQDGRMIPTLFQGAWYQNTSLAGLTLDLGFISHAYARSGPGWARIQNTLGIYPQGRTADGMPASYFRSLSSLGIFVAGAAYKHDLFSASAWDHAFENIFNVVYSDAFFTPSVGDVGLRFGAQYVGGQKLGNGGSDDPAQRYFDRNTFHAFGAKAELKTKSDFVFAANYNRITKSGPYLFPRELGVEPLFVFLKRERTEGSGDVHAFSVQAQQTFKLGGAFQKLSTALAYGQYYRTDPRDAELNKYGFPSLYQINWDTFLYFGEGLEGLAGELLVVYKGPLSDTYDNPRFEINKVNMLHVDLILNYTF